MVPGGVPGGPGVPRASRDAFQGAPGALFGWVLGECLRRVKTEKWSGNGFISVQKCPKSTGLENKVRRIKIFGVPGPGGPQKGPKMTDLGFQENRIFDPFLETP